MAPRLVRLEVVAGHVLVRHPGLGELDEGPVGVTGVDEGLLPLRAVGRDVEERDPR